MSKDDIAHGHRGVPLNSVRVFVEVGRALSFTRAAVVLGMTQSGVSHHVNGLEKTLGHRLFERSGASVSLTDVGRQYFDAVREAVATIELSTRQLLDQSSESRLVVRTSLPTVAMNVIIPALSQFTTQPPVAVDLVTSLSPPAATDVYDVLLTRDLTLADEAHWQLAHETLVCVAAPGFIAQTQGAGSVDIARWPFITARSRPDVLVEWVNGQGFEASSIRVCAAFEHYFLALSAAIGGMGYLIVPKILIAESLRQGHLVDVGLPPVTGTSCYTAWVNPRSNQADVARSFCRWLMGVFRAMEGALP